MTPDQFEETLNQIDDKYLEEAEQARSRRKDDNLQESKDGEALRKKRKGWKPKMRRILPIAACLAILATAGGTILSQYEKSSLATYDVSYDSVTVNSGYENSGESSRSYTGMSDTAGEYTNDGAEADTYTDGDMASAEQKAAGNDSTSATSANSTIENSADTEEDSSDYEQKLIRTYNYYIDTEDYEASMDFIYSNLEKYDGYMESSEVYGTDYPQAYLVLRIPTESVSEFLDTVGSIGEITYQSVSSEDVTLTYYDISAKLEALEAQHARLLELMEQAESISDLATLESQLSDVEYQINSCQSQLKVYDNLVDYTTVNINLTTVAPEQVVEKDGFWTRVRKGFVRNTQGVLEFLENAAIGILSALPVLILLALAAGIFVCIIRIIRRHRK